MISNNLFRQYDSMWKKVEEETYFPVFKCRECGNIVIVEDECLLPEECNNCKKLKISGQESIFDKD